MSLLMYYDTETTNKTDFKAAWNASHQPDLVQLGYKVYDVASREVVFEIGHIVNTMAFETYNMSAEAQAVHGITPDLIKEYGWSPVDSLSLFVRWLNRCKYKVAHNDQFDTRVMQLFAYRCGWSPEIFNEQQAICTMMASTNVCKLPHPKGWNSFKWPSLAEAYTFFTGQQMSGAHNALVDVNAGSEVLWGLIDRGHLRLEV